MLKRLLALTATLIGLAAPSFAQGYTTPPILQSFQATGLTLPYTIGMVAIGGTQAVIQAGTVVLADNQYSCQSPQYPACNIVYWPGSGTALVVTSSPSVAYASGNSVVGFVTTSGGVIGTVTTFFQASEVSDNLLPIGFVSGIGGLRLPLCNALLTTQCQPRVSSLSGY